LTTVGLVTALLFDLLLLPALLIVIYGRNSPVAAFLGRFSETRQKAGENEPEHADTGLDEAYWTSERKIALVKEIMSGKIAVAAAARQYALPEVEVEKWLATADTGINEAFGGVDTGPAGDPDKIRALAKAYRLLQAENRALKAHQQE
jgi:transposase-like protein